MVDQSEVLDKPKRAGLAQFVSEQPEIQSLAAEVAKPAAVDPDNKNQELSEDVAENDNSDLSDEDQNKLLHDVSSESGFVDRSGPKKGRKKRMGRRRSTRTLQWTVKLKPADVDRIADIAEDLDCVYAAVIEKALDALQLQIKSGK